MTKRAALYVRTSTADQDGGGQLHALLQAATVRGFEPIQYTDIGHSGAKASRPALDRMRADARHGKLDVIMVVGLDRLGRSLRDLLDLLAELDASGAKLVSLREGVDLTTPAGKFFLHIMGALADFERELITERVRAGVARARAEGKHCGRPRRADAPEPAKVRTLRALGRSWAQCAAELSTNVGAARRACKARA